MTHLRHYFPKKAKRRLLRDGVATTSRLPSTHFTQPRPTADLYAAARVSENMECPEGSARFRAREFDYLGPFLRFIRNKLAEISRGARQDFARQVGKPRAHRGIIERCIHLFV